MSTDDPFNGSDRPQPFGPFLLERRLAVGGSAEVFLARPRYGTNPAPRFVIKRVLSRTDQDEAFRMLVHEAELNQAVRHPNVVEVYGAGQVDGEPYLAMEYVEGVDLYRLLRRCESEQRTLPLEICVYVARRIAAALAAVHSCRDSAGRLLEIVHRDVTPSNVYLSNDGAIKVGDFGIARVVPSRARTLQHTAGLKGKFGYLSPEQIAGEPFDSRADLFALAAVLGEMLIGERVFPGSGQLAVLLAIRDGNIEPLRKQRHLLPKELYDICLLGLSREPATRFQTAEEFETALLPFEAAASGDLRASLASLVRWAGDSAQLAKRLKGQIRDSVDRMRAVRLAQASGAPPSPESVPSMKASGAVESVPPSERITANVRLRSGKSLGDVGFARLVEMLATGELRGDDEVGLMGESMRPVCEVVALSRYLAPSTTATTSRLSPVGIPDYQAELSDTPLLEILARFRGNSETGALFVEREDDDGTPRRKEAYIREGRLLHVAAGERDELLGEYLVRRGALERKELDTALELIGRSGGRLGDTLVSMGFVDAVDVFRAIRDLGRDRVAALCGWSHGRVTFYRGTAPSHVEFPLDLDLASPMMAGVLLSNQRLDCADLPNPAHLVVLGPRAALMASRKERGTVPLALLLLQQLATKGLSIQAAIDELVTFRTPSSSSRSITDKEAAAALAVGQLLGWIAFESPRS